MEHRSHLPEKDVVPARTGLQDEFSDVIDHFPR